MTGASDLTELDVFMSCGIVENSTTLVGYIGIIVFGAGDARFILDTTTPSALRTFL